MIEAMSHARQFRVHPIIWRRIHKWVGLILGAQFVLWTISGATMALLNQDKVGGHAMPMPSAAAIQWRGELIAPSRFGPVEQFTLRPIAGRPVYEIVRAGETQLVDAERGTPVTVDAVLAQAIARQAFGLEAPVSSTERLAKPNLEAREHHGPLWRVNFGDEEHHSAYVSAVTGRALVSRGDTWRTWDFVWMLHNMDYVNRTSFNHPLIIFVAFGTLWLSFTGFYLLFKSFRRRDFRWLAGRR